MQGLRKAGFALAIIGAITTITVFQNCAPGFQADFNSEIEFSPIDFSDVENMSALDDFALPKNLKSDAVAATTVKNPLKTSGNQIIDAVTKKNVAFSGASWQGFETPNASPVGLYAREMKSLVTEFKTNGFNVLRIPVSLSMFNAGVVPKDINFTLNPGLAGKNPQQILDLLITACGSAGIRVILVIHRLKAGQGTEAGGVWYSATSPESAWIARWKALAARYKGNNTVIGADLFNEPHHPAKWGGGGANDWARAAEAAGNAIHSVNPNWLIIVEGVSGWSKMPGVPYDSVEGWWSQNLQGVANRPIKLKLANKVVYSPHIYPPQILGNYPKELFESSKFPGNMAAVWNTSFGFIYTKKIAPIWIGEFAFNETGKANVAKCNFQDSREPKWTSAWLKYLAGDFNLDGKSDLVSGSRSMSWAYWDWGFDDCGRYLFEDVGFKKTNAKKLLLLKPVQHPAF